VKGQCGGGFFVRGGTRPPGAARTPPAGGFQRSGSFGFAFGSVTKLTGSTLTVKGAAFGSKKTSTTTTTTVTLSSKTALSETKTIKAADVQLKTCAFVRGTSPDKGKTVKATDVALTPERNGKCTTGFRRPGS
jgi:hypothetical protein